MFMLRGLLAAVAAGLLLTACGKSEPPAKARANAPVQIPQPDASGSSGGKVDPNEGLKERLARQEAASKLFDKTKPEPPPKAEPKAPAESRSAAATKAEPAKPEPVKAEPPKPVEAPPPVAEKKAEPAPAPRTDVAAAKPAATPPPPPPSVQAAKLVSRVDPDFPREAAQQGIDKGHVKVRMTLDANGNVTKVDIIEAVPRRVFDRAVVRALSQWRFNDGASGRTVETEVEFRPQ
ncbi:energy transducer TonB [Usitatibacter palustris]|uniref:Protein TonB n=1 Tax=Usitatibacter palustris TaxID=2732487 RepID=A0A6M4H9B9_9PROT|nr:energy transducer TonB [Usitatibacter palustris]QJR16166.1 hypothetical protein DSM104440_02995 [Usitatibacter palustris]